MPEKKEVQKATVKKPVVKNDSPVMFSENMIMTAVEKGLDVQALNGLYDLRSKMKLEFAEEQFYQALSLFQSSHPEIKKDKDVMAKDGKSVRYSYASLDRIVNTVKDTLTKCGLSYTITTKQDTQFVTAICEVHHVSGYSKSTEFTIPVDPTAYMNVAQKVASALTYAKRYSFCNAFGIMTADEDDDARSLSNMKEKTDISVFNVQESINHVVSLIKPFRAWMESTNYSKLGYFLAIGKSGYSEQQYKNDLVEAGKIMAYAEMFNADQQSELVIEQDVSEFVQDQIVENDIEDDTPQKKDMVYLIIEAVQEVANDLTDEQINYFAGVQANAYPYTKESFDRDMAMIEKIKNKKKLNMNIGIDNIENVDSLYQHVSFEKKENNVLPRGVL